MAKNDPLEALREHYLQRLKNGELLSADQFVQELSEPLPAELVEALRFAEREFRRTSLLNESEARVPAPSSVGTTDLLPSKPNGEVIGPYKLLQRIGEGGMGVVYMAQQSRPVARYVALKIVKPGMDSREILARFEAERQALALMDHPNTTRVLDAGSTSLGRPYFVMELVKGIPITQYCDEKHLTIKDRLELFLPVCEAVQHAHQKGIIHRDLKPSNVLIAQYDSRPVPKIIDFGLAKALGQRLTEKTMFTQYGQLLGTVDYMSPEQAAFNQLDVDTRSDIYSLGVLLYELLTGETPFDKKRLRSAAFDELLRIIRQEEPPRPSARLSSHASLPAIAANRRLEPKKLSTLVRGELDWIVMKSLEKERDRRYQSAGEFADDIRRYLGHQTVLACPPSTTYVLRKFVRRNRTLVTSGITVFSVLIVALAAITWSLFRASRAEAGEKNARNREGRLSEVPWIQQIQTERIVRFEHVFYDFLNHLTTAEVAEDRLGDSETQARYQQLLREAIRFWDGIVESAVDPVTRKPTPRQPYYRLQRALCLARAGDDKQAFAEVIALESEGQIEGNREEAWVRDLFRIGAICAKCAKDDSVLARQYVDVAIRYLHRAGELGAGPPPQRDDPELNALSTHPAFYKILDEWRSKYSFDAADQSTIAN